MQISPAKVAKLPAPVPEEPEPSLGDVRFDEWFETPVFESDADERLEELVMSRRGPLRLAASALLRVNARSDRSGRRSGRRPEPTADFYDSALWADDSDEPWWPAEDPAAAAATHTDDDFSAGEEMRAEDDAWDGDDAAQVAPAAVPPRPAASAKARPTGAATAPSRTRRSGPAATRPAAAKTTKKAPATKKKPPAGKRARSAAPTETGPAVEEAQPDPTPAADDAAFVELPAVTATEAPAVAAGPRRGLRGRVSSALDRWAEMEAQTQYRLERLMLPKRWQSHDAPVSLP